MTREQMDAEIQATIQQAVREAFALGRLHGLAEARTAGFRAAVEHIRAVNAPRPSPVRLVSSMETPAPC